jgi:CBS domain containing-hemolysin-like protein
LEVRLKKKEKGNKQTAGPQYRWILRIFFVAISLSAVLSLLSATILEGAGLILALVVLLIFILLGILFDIIGVAVTAADERPFHSMAAHKEKGAVEALRLLHNASHVSSFCNDVVGDICGIVSGTTAAVIVSRLQSTRGAAHSVLLSVGITALISGLTIGGKAIGKTLAITQSTRVVFLTGRFLHFFQRSSR